jgi:membrane associated rhomboid family serine protease
MSATRIPRNATVILSIVIALLWAIVALIGADERAAVLMGFIPARLSGLVDLSPAVPAILTPLTATLVHGGLVHLAFNLLIFVWCGMMVERALGTGPLLLLFAVGAYASAMAQWAFDPASMVPMIGASGAISAVIGAYSLSFGKQKQLVKSPALNRALNALWLLAAWVVLQLMTAFMAGEQGMLLATPAHIGGFVAGLLMQRPLLMWRYRRA